MSSETGSRPSGDATGPDGDADHGGSPFLDADSDEEPTLTVVLPTLNEAEGIGECLDRVAEAVRELGVTAEVIVSDSSTDRTPEIARDRGAIVVSPDESGYGYAYRYAFEQARGEYVAMGDADTTYDFRELPKLYRLVADGDADVALGSRLEGDIEAGAMPNLHQYLGNPLLTRFLNSFYDAGVSDAHSGFRVLSRSALDRLELDSDGMEFASEMIMDASAKGMTIREEPITYHEREGEATLHSFRDGWRHVRFMLVNAPGYLFSGPGVGMVVAGLVGMALALGNVTVAGSPLAERTMIAGSLLTIVGLQAVSLGVFSRIAGDPIRQPSDPLTGLIASAVTLERGASVGIVLFVAGAVHAGLLLYEWSTAGYGALPSLTVDIAAFTAIVVGLQVVFHALFVSVLADARSVDEE